MNTIMVAERPSALVDALATGGAALVMHPLPVLPRASGPGTNQSMVRLRLSRVIMVAIRAAAAAVTIRKWHKRSTCELFQIGLGVRIKVVCHTNTMYDM